MRKTTTIKSGLNVRKAGGATQAPIRGPTAGSSVFSATPPTDHPPGQRPPPTSTAPTHDPTLDASVYAYDSLYDDISSTRTRLKARRTDTDRDSSGKPKYMAALIETAKQRQVQREVARERLLDKQREREGAQYADKECFVTQGYRKQKEERRKAVEDEERREAVEENAREGAGGFRNLFLQHVDRSDIARAMGEPGEPGESVVRPGGGDDKPKQRTLGAGLNVVAANKKQASISGRSGGSRWSDREQLPPYQQQQHSRQHQARQYRGGRALDDELAQQRARQAEEKQRERQALIRKYARRNTDADIEAARQRYRQRKHARAHV